MLVGCVSWVSQILEHYNTDSTHDETATLFVKETINVSVLKDGYGRSFFSNSLKYVVSFSQKIRR